MEKFCTAFSLFSIYTKCVQSQSAGAHHFYNIDLKSENSVLLLLLLLCGIFLPSCTCPLDTDKNMAFKASPHMLLILKQTIHADSRNGSRRSGVGATGGGSGYDLHTP